MRKKGLATAVLLASAAGAAGFGWLATETQSLVPGILAHGCLAATVGGLADWFAVTAIFRKPLGISWRTEILRRNRARIMRALADFAGTDVLSRAHIMAGLRKQDFAGMAVEYLTRRGGRARLCALADAAFTRGVESLDPRRVAEALDAPARRALSGARLDVLASDGLAALAAPETRACILRALLPAVRAAWRDERLQAALLGHVASVREAYVGDSWMRASLFASTGLSDEKLLAHLDRRAASLFDALEKGEGELYDRLSSWLEGVLRDEARAARIAAEVRAWQTRRVEELDVAGWLTARLSALRENALLSWRRALRMYVEARLTAFEADEEARRDFNDFLLAWFERILTRYHAEIPRLMERRLERLSDEALVELAETRVADDLQMIRINGAVVGSVVGMLLYMLTLIVGKGGV